MSLPGVTEIAAYLTISVMKYTTVCNSWRKKLNHEPMQEDEVVFVTTILYTLACNVPGILGGPVRTSYQSSLETTDILYTLAITCQEY